MKKIKGSMYIRVLLHYVITQQNKLEYCWVWSLEFELKCYWRPSWSAIAVWFCIGVLLEFDFGLECYWSLILHWSATGVWFCIGVLLESDFHWSSNDFVLECYWSSILRWSSSLIIAGVKSSSLNIVMHKINLQGLVW